MAVRAFAVDFVRAHGFGDVACALRAVESRRGVLGVRGVLCKDVGGVCCAGEVMR